MIAEYLQRLQRILGDQNFQRFNPYDLLDYINEARGFVAAQGECVRTLIPSTAGLSTIDLTSGGSGYTSAPTVTVSPPSLGTQATATATVVGGAVILVQVLTPGSGYAADKIPTVTFSGGGGEGAAAVATLMPSVHTIAGQEVYKFEDLSPLVLSAQTGAERIIAINSVAVSWGSMKPTLRALDWGSFQAYLRSYNVGVQGYPRVWSQFGRGTQGSFYIWPIPAQDSQMDLDCICLPQALDLQSNKGMEPIPWPWTNAVPYKAAEIAVLGMPDLRELSESYAKHYERRMIFAAATTMSGRIPDYYNPASRL